MMNPALQPEPTYFPVAGDPAARLITAVAMHDGTEAALRIAGAVTAGVWAQQRDIAAPAALATMLAECGLDAARLEQSQQPEVQARYEEQTQAAIDLGVFGAPTYLVDGEMFWGQDRLDFVARKLRA
jgi:2-hydroxychromene-2-carboxylate isomerase